MKIAIVCYPTHGGSGVVASELGIGLAEKGHEIHIVSYAQPFRLSSFHQNLFVHEVGVASYPLFKYPPYALGLATKLVELVEQCDIDCGIKTGDKGSARFEYANLWQMMCGTAHAHLVQIARSPVAHTLIAVNGAVVATFALLRATAVIVAPDADGIKEIVEAMGQQIHKILKG